MAKGKFERTKPHVNVGTIGHVDHGNRVRVENIAQGGQDWSQRRWSELDGSEFDLPSHRRPKPRKY